MNNYSRNTSRLKNHQFDALIIGGGISGAWIALHCAKLGLKTALVEQHDFGSQTSSASSKLLHGGIRYLQQMQFDKVRESALERAHYLYAAPHLSNPVPFIIPTYKDLKRSKLFLGCGMLVYGALRMGESGIIASSATRPPSTKSISADTLNTICDLSHSNHTGAIVFPEYHMYDSERMVLSILQTARSFGAETVNYLAAKKYLKYQGKITGVIAEDKLNSDQSGKEFNISSRLVINAAGPWIDNLNKTIDKEKNPFTIAGFAVGSHIITRQLVSEHAIALTTKHKSATKIDRGGRHVFIIPWRGYSLIGTSYDELKTPNTAIKIKKKEINQLLEDVNDALPSANLSTNDIISGYTGIYPLHTTNIKSSVYQGSGEYQIIDHAQSQNTEGLITALGAKFTTGRVLAKKTVKLASKKLLGSTTTIGKIKLHNSHFSSLKKFTEQKLVQYRFNFPAKIIKHLIYNYGSNIDEFLEFIKAHKQLHTPICKHQPDLMGQVAWAMEKEMAVTLNDVLFRRTSVGLLGISEEEISAVARLMAKYLQWNIKQTNEQIAFALEKVNAIN